MLSVDGIGAFDLISRAGCDRALPFVRQFYGRPSKYFWEDDFGTTHEILQGEGGEEGDPLMPALFALGQHRALVAAQSAMHPSAKLMAFQDDVYVVSSPPQVAACYTHLERELWAHAGIRINLGKTQIFNRAGALPPDCQHIIRAGRLLNPPVVVWRGDSALPPDQRGVTILGTPLGHLDFVKAQLRAKAEEHRILLNRVEAMTAFSARGSFSLSVASQGRIITSAPSSQRGQKNSQQPTTPSTLQAFRAGWEAWVCGTQSEELKQRIGPVGPIRCT